MSDAVKELLDAAREGDSAGVLRLLAAGVSPNCGIVFARVNRKAHNPDMTPMTCAIDGKHSHIVRLLLNAGANPNAIDDEGCSALASAALSKNEQIVRTLLDAGANPSLGRWDTGLTPLMIATMVGNVAIVRMLLEARANPQSRDDNGNSVMFYAKGEEKKEVMNLLKQFNVDLLVKLPA